MSEKLEPSKKLYTKVIESKHKGKDHSVFKFDESDLESLCKNFDVTVEKMVRNYKNTNKEIWDMVRENSINFIGVKCLPYMCNSLKFNNIERIISLVDDKGSESTE
jgi:hypothetical protein